MLKYSLALSFLVMFFIPQAFADIFGVSDYSLQESDRELRGTIKGILEFTQVSDSVCDVSAKIQQGVIEKTDDIKTDESKENLFVRVSNKDSAQVWQMQITYPANNIAYDIHLKNGDRQLSDALYNPESNVNLGVILEPDASANIAESNIDTHLLLPEFDRFLKQIGNDSYLTFGLPVEKNDFTLNIVFFDSKRGLVSNDTCAKKVMIPIQVDKDGIAQIGEVQLSNIMVSDVTRDFPPLKQQKLGVGDSSVECKPGFMLILQETDQYGTKRPACVHLDTRDKLIERGWTKQTSDIPASIDPDSENIKKLITLLENGKISEFNNLKEQNTPAIILEGVNLQGQDLRSLNLKLVVFRGANLQDAILKDMKVYNKGLSDTNLQGADLRNTDISDAYMFNTNLQGANLSNADLINAKLSGAKNLPISSKEARELGAIVD